ncbi:MAG: hypothetical protein EXS35_08090 [Pedosphaera sp.]|nr:hypothetical protein [Pedosphaera sp.]
MKDFADSPRRRSPLLCPAALAATRDSRHRTVGGRATCHFRSRNRLPQPGTTETARLSLAGFFFGADGSRAAAPKCTTISRGVPRTMIENHPSLTAGIRGFANIWRQERRTLTAGSRPDAQTSARPLAVSDSWKPNALAELAMLSHELRKKTAPLKPIGTEPEEQVVDCRVGVDAR